MNNIKLHFLSFIALAAVFLNGCSNFTNDFSSANVADASHNARKKTIEQALAEKNLIHKPVHGLYSSIPNTKTLDMGNGLHHIILDAPPPKWETYVMNINTGDEGASLSRKYNRDDKSMEFILASLDSTKIPSFLNCSGCKELVDGRGTPTIVLMNLHLFRYYNIEYGSLKSANSGIANRESMMEILFHPDIIEFAKRNRKQDISDLTLNNVIVGIPSIRYLATILIQSGHEILEFTYNLSWKKKDVSEFPESLYKKFKEHFGEDVGELVIPSSLIIDFKLAPAKVN